MGALVLRVGDREELERWTTSARSPPTTAPRRRLVVGGREGVRGWRQGGTRAGSIAIVSARPRRLNEGSRRREPSLEKDQAPGDRPRPNPSRVHGCRFSPSPLLTLACARSTTSPVRPETHHTALLLVEPDRLLDVAGDDGEVVEAAGARGWAGVLGPEVRSAARSRRSGPRRRSPSSPTSASWVGRSRSAQGATVSRRRLRVWLTRGWLVRGPRERSCPCITPTSCSPKAPHCGCPRPPPDEELCPWSEPDKEISCPRTETSLLEHLLQDLNAHDRDRPGRRPRRAGAHPREGSNHFFFDIGHDNLLAFFDFPGLYVGTYAEVLGGLHHIAISVEPATWSTSRASSTRPESSTSRRAARRSTSVTPTARGSS
jgi:hypothetical protein